MIRFLKKWYIYQKERFPILIYGLYIFMIVLGIHSFEISISEHYIFIGRFILGMISLLCVRILDEFKDYDEDCKYRPYRPVPRGLITLKELKILLVICAILQVVITLHYMADLFCLVIFWIYLSLMYKNFFIKNLDKHILLTAFLDEILMPILVIYLLTFTTTINLLIDSCDFCLWLLPISYIVAWIVEVARKVRCKEDEEKGVKTYTAVLGINKTVLLLFILETILLIIQILVFKDIKGKIFEIYNLISIILPYIIINIFNFLFIKNKSKKYAKIVEISANAYIIFVYLSFAIITYNSMNLC